MIKKILKRFYRIIRYRTKVYGKLGKNNTFVSPSYSNEASIIGNNNYFGPYTMINNAIIGNYCSIGPGVKIGQGVHSKDFITTYQPISRKLINYSLNTSPAIISNDVWIGANAVIMQDVKIGNGAIIGANAVVTKDVPPFAIAVGVPAKIIKNRFDDETIQLIKESMWYELPYDKAIEKIEEIMSKRSY